MSFSDLLFPESVRQKLVDKLLTVGANTLDQAGAPDRVGGTLRKLRSDTPLSEDIASAWAQAIEDSVANELISREAARAMTETSDAEPELVAEALTRVLTAPAPLWEAEKDKLSDQLIVALRSQSVPSGYPEAIRVVITRVCQAMLGHEKLVHIQQLNLQYIQAQATTTAAVTMRQIAESIGLESARHGVPGSYGPPAELLANHGQADPLLTGHRSDQPSSGSLSPGLEDLIEASVLYAQDVEMDTALYVPRSLEPALLEALMDRFEASSHLVVGEAGSGKSTLLWSLYRTLQQSSGYVPVWVPVLWMTRPGTNLTVEELVSAVVGLDDGRMPVLLVDTVDLLLHDDASRAFLLNLIRQVARNGVRAAYATRPQEAPLISSGILRHWFLESFDDSELPQAVSVFASRYCPSEDTEFLLDEVTRATSRGLPVADVCRSPLMLRMLFDISSPERPVLDDMDVTGLFKAYWNRRVLRDIRKEADLSLRDSSGDLSSTAGMLAIGLLAWGAPRLPPGRLADAVGLTASPGRPFSAGQIAEELHRLQERGVISSDSYSAGFFHQTMFEFTAAHALLERADPDFLGILTRRTLEGQGDLFVGAVLEQALILVDGNPLTQDAAADAVGMLSKSPSEAIQSIAAAAWAHDPTLLTTSLTEIGVAALCRAARIVPTVGRKPSRESIAQLLQLWEASPDAEVKVQVLAALTRVAGRDPRRVANTLPKLSLPKTLAESSRYGALRDATLSLLAIIAPITPDLARQVVTTMLNLEPSSIDKHVEFLAAAWSYLGDGSLLQHVMDIAFDPDRPNRLTAKDLGLLLAKEWHRAGMYVRDADWHVFVDNVVAEANQQTAPAWSMINVFAIAHFTTGLAAADARCDYALQRLLEISWPDEPDLIGEVVLPEVLNSKTPASDTLQYLTRDLLSNLITHKRAIEPDKRQLVLLAMLAETISAEEWVDRLLPQDMGEPVWTSAPAVAKLLPLAAEQGRESAATALASMANCPGKYPDSIVDAVFQTVSAYLVPTGEVYDMLISLAVASDHPAVLGQFMLAADWHDHRLASHIPRLMEYGKALLSSKERDKMLAGADLLATLMQEADDDCFDWDWLHGQLQRLPGDEYLTDLWRGTAVQDDPSSVHDRIAYFSQYVTVEPGKTIPVRSTLPPDIIAEDAAEAATAALFALQADLRPEPSTWERIKTLGLYPPDSDQVTVTPIMFVGVCTFLSSIAEHSPVTAATNFYEYLAQMTTGTFISGNRSIWWQGFDALLLKNVASTEHLLSILELLPRMDYVLAEVIVTGLAEAAWDECAAHLHRVTTRPDLPSAIRVLILDTLRDKGRAAGTRHFREVLGCVHPNRLA